MKKLIILLTIMALANSVTFSQETSMSTFDATKLFENELNEYRHKKDVGVNMLLWGLTGIGTGFLLSTTGTTLHSMDGYTDYTTYDTMTTTGYIVIPVSTIITVIGSWLWIKNTDKYQETLNLRMNYLNMVD